MELETTYQIKKITYADGTQHFYPIFCERGNDEDWRYFYNDDQTERIRFTTLGVCKSFIRSLEVVAIDYLDYPDKKESE